MKKQLPFLIIFFFTIKCYGIKLTVNYIGDRKLETLEIKQFDIVLQKYNILAETTIDKNEIFKFDFDLAHSGMCEVLNSFIFLTNTDDIVLTISRDFVLNCEGLNCGNYTFKSYAKKWTFPDYSFYKQDKLNYKNVLTNYFANEQAILDTFNLKGQISKEFYGFMKKEIRLSYLLSLVDIANISNDISPTFLSDISVTDLSSIYKSNIFFQFIFSYYLYSFKNNLVENNYGSYIGMIKKIEEKFPPETKDYIIFYFYWHLCKEQSVENRTFFKTFYKKIKAINKISYLSEKIDYWYAYYSKINQKFPDNVLEENLVSLIDGKEIKFKNILAKHKDKVIYLDFWASWCGPCVQEIPALKQLEKSIDSSDLIFINVSIDEDDVAWKKSVEKYSLSRDNQYLLKNSKEKQLIKYLEISGIPKYYIIDRIHNLSFFNTFRPSDDNLKRVLFENMKVKKKD